MVSMVNGDEADAVLQSVLLWTCARLFDWVITLFRDALACDEQEESNFYHSSMVYQLIMNLMVILMVLLDCRRRVNCAKHVEPYPVSLHHSYEVYTCLVYLVDSPTFSSRQKPWLTHLSRQ